MGSPADFHLSRDLTTIWHSAFHQDQMQSLAALINGTKCNIRNYGEIAEGTGSFVRNERKKRVCLFSSSRNIHEFHFKLYTLSNFILNSFIIILNSILFQIPARRAFSFIAR